MAQHVYAFISEYGVRITERGHLFMLDKWISEPGAPHMDCWRLEDGIHNGPECIDCGKVVCEHCNPGFLTEECPCCLVCGHVQWHKMDCPNR